MHTFQNKRVLITGACGTISQELLRQLRQKYSAAEVVAVDNNESELFFLEQKFLRHPNARFFLADTRDPVFASTRFGNVLGSDHDLSCIENTYERNGS